MNITSRLSFLTLLALCLSACGGATEIPPTEGVSISNVYTAAALTLTSQADAFTPTALASPTATLTLWASPTITTSTPTSQTVNSSYSTAYGCYNAAYVSDVTIPDGTVLAPGEAFTKTWKLQNTGGCDWNADFLLAYETGTDMDGVDTYIEDYVTAGDTVSISVPLVAPETEGTYTGYWRLSTDSGEAFGGSVFVMIVVSEGAATATPTYTATATNTAYAEDTPTYTPTCTATPSPTPTEVEESMETKSNTLTSVEEDGPQSDGE
jgi:hypothetical protein